MTRPTPYKPAAPPKQKPKKSLGKSVVKQAPPNVGKFGVTVEGK